MRYFIRLVRGRFFPSAPGIFRSDLSALLARAERNLTLGDKILWIEELVSWVRISADPEGVKSGAQIQSVRVKFFLNTLDKNVKWKIEVSRIFSSVLLETDPVLLLCNTGLNTGSGFFSEAWERFFHKILPYAKNEKNLSELFSKLFFTETDPEWLEGLDAASFQGIGMLFLGDQKTIQLLGKKYQNAVGDSMLILSSHLESLALSSDIRMRTRVSSVRWSAFYQLRMAVSKSLESGFGLDFSNYFRLCREELASAFIHLEQHGVSISIVYRLEKMERYLSRLEKLVSVQFESGGHSQRNSWHILVVDLIRCRLQSDRIRNLIQHNLHMISRKIVERVGESAEPYITQSKEQYFRMLVSAAGGGVVTAFTAMIKLLLGKANYPLFFEGFFSWMNYSFSFLFMQVFHLTLATKQPSMTAPVLAAKLKESVGLDEFADLVTRIIRSQFAAAVGNLGIVVPTALVINFLVLVSYGHPFLDPQSADNVIKSFDPFRSLTLPFAALTGLLLWLSSIVAGWAENWFVFHRFPETLSQLPWLENRIGVKRSLQWSAWLNKNIAGMAGNLSLGFFLAFTPILGQFFGLPMDVRHVTLSAASLTFAFCGATSVSQTSFFLGVLSVVLIGALNFGISFLAALFVALKARDVRGAKGQALLVSLGLRWKRAPSQFFFPTGFGGRTSK